MENIFYFNSKFEKYKYIIQNYTFRYFFIGILFFLTLSYFYRIAETSMLITFFIFLIIYIIINIMRTIFFNYGDKKLEFTSHSIKFKGSFISTRFFDIVSERELSLSKISNVKLNKNNVKISFDGYFDNAYFLYKLSPFQIRSVKFPIKNKEEGLKIMNHYENLKNSSDASKFDRNLNEFDSKTSNLSDEEFKQFQVENNVNLDPISDKIFNKLVFIVVGILLLICSVAIYFIITA